MISDNELAAQKELFLHIYNTAIRRDGKEQLLDWLENSDFFIAPASARYHGSYPGGLLEHSLNVYNCLMEQVRLYGSPGEWPHETIALVSLMHDVCKVNLYKKGFRNVKDENGKWYQKEVYEYDELFPVGHGEKSVIILQMFMKLSTEEIMAIRAHMGGFDTSQRIVGDIFNKSKLAVLLHLADMSATYLIEGV